MKTLLLVVVLTVAAVLLRWLDFGGPHAAARHPAGGHHLEPNASAITTQGSLPADAGSNLGQHEMPVSVGGTHRDSTPGYLENFQRRNVLLANPAGLEAAIQAVLANKSPSDAHALAKLVRECEGIESAQAATYEMMHGASPAPVSRGWLLEALKEQQQVAARCQAIQSNPAELRYDLLKIAFDGGEFGAAADFYLQSSRLGKLPTSLPAIRTKIESDARQGDLASAWILVTDPGMGADEEHRLAIQRALEMLGKDTLTENHVEPYLRSKQFMQPIGAHAHYNEELAMAYMTNMRAKLIEKYGARQDFNQNS